VVCVEVVDKKKGGGVRREIMKRVVTKWWARLLWVIKSRGPLLHGGGNVQVSRAARIIRVYLDHNTLSKGKEGEEKKKGQTQMYVTGTVHSDSGRFKEARCVWREALGCLIQNRLRSR